MRPTSVVEISSVAIKSCIKLDASSSRSHDSPCSFRNIPLPTSSPTVQQHPGPRVVFNSYVEQSIIIDASSEQNDSGSDTDVVSEFGLDNDEILLKRTSRAFGSPSYNKDSDEETDEEPTLVAPKRIRCATFQPVDLVLIQALPPTQIFPKVAEEERGVTVIFIPPKVHGALKEEDVLPTNTKPPTPPTSKLQRTPSSHDLATTIKNEMAEMALGEMRGARSRGAPSLGGARARGGWLLLNVSDSSGEEELFLPPVTTRRRLREKRTQEAKAKARFSFGDENEEGNDEGKEGSKKRWETVGAPEVQCRDGDDAASGRITDSQIRACVQGNTYGVHGTVETSSETGVYRGEKESKEGVPSTIGTIFETIDGEATKVNQSKMGGVVGADVEEGVKEVVELGDAGVWVEQGHREEGGEGRDSQAAAVGPLTRSISWVKSAASLRFWKK